MLVDNRIFAIFNHQEQPFFFFFERLQTVLLWFCLMFVVWLILDCYIEDDGAMKSRFLLSKGKQGVGHL